MIKISLNLPKKTRLHLHLVRRRESAYKQPLLPSLEVIKSTRKGSKISRYFRHVFEHKNIKRLLGVNLAVVAATAVFMPTQSTNIDLGKEDVVIQEKYAVLTTQRSTQYPMENVSITPVSYTHLTLPTTPYV